MNMSDQVQSEQSPQSRLEAFLDGDVSNDIPVNLDAEEDVALNDENANPEADEEEIPDEEAPDEDSEEEQSYLTLKINGEEVDKPLEEVISLAQQGADYTKKTQEVAEQRKALEEYAQTIQVQEQQLKAQAELQQALFGELAQITAIDQQLADFQAIDWNQLSENDFVEAQKLFFTQNKLQTQRSQLVQQLEAKQQQLTQAQQKSLNERIAKGKEVLAKEIPNWSPDTSKAIISAGKEYYGFSDEEMSSVIDPRHVKVLHDAMQWRKLQQNTGVKNKVSTAKPVIKPGSKDVKKQVGSDIQRARESLRKTGKSDYAQKLIEQML
jgi:multidrug efflux pump subunit AcrA (membrane-fusion protein)